MEDMKKMIEEKMKEMVRLYEKNNNVTLPTSENVAGTAAIGQEEQPVQSDAFSNAKAVSEVLSELITNGIADKLEPSSEPLPVIESTGTGGTTGEVGGAGKGEYIADSGEREKQIEIQLELEGTAEIELTKESAYAEGAEYAEQTKEEEVAEQVAEEVAEGAGGAVAAEPEITVDVSEPAAPQDEDDTPSYEVDYGEESCPRCGRCCRCGKRRRCSRCKAPEYVDATADFSVDEIESAGEEQQVSAADGEQNSAVAFLQIIVRSGRDNMPIKGAEIKVVCGKLTVHSVSDSEGISHNMPISMDSQSSVQVSISAAGHYAVRQAELRLERGKKFLIPAELTPLPPLF
ncbi:MAG: hypothetical protein LBL82_05570 [Oscillospiraceae bacterium]|nr:hypothetical protein [Oscillospiraceae bacterium]